MIDYLKSMLITSEGKLFYVLGLIVVLMTIDCISGFVSAIVTKTVDSGKITVGVLKKGLTLIMLSVLIPMALLLPDGIGLGILFITYMLAMLGEFTSILENFKKMGIDVVIFQSFIDKFIDKE